MSWTVDFDETSKIAVIVATGTYTARDMQEATSKCIALEKEEVTNRFLLDATGVEFTASLADILKVPAHYFDEGADRLGRVAVLPPRSREARAAAEFFETASRNRGWKVQLFLDRQEAVAWLVDSDSPGKADGRRLPVVPPDLHAKRLMLSGNEQLSPPRQGG